MRLEVEVNLPDGFGAENVNGELVVSRAGKSLRRVLPRRKLAVEIENNVVKFCALNKQSRALAGTFAAHLRNMIAGLTEPFAYELKVCSTHFPMSVKVEDGKLIVQNFLGSKSPTPVKLPNGVDVKVQGDHIIVTSDDIELAGMAASRIEKSTHLSNKDRRVFQDGIYITKKAKGML